MVGQIVGVVGKLVSKNAAQTAGKAVAGFIVAEGGSRVLEGAMNGGSSAVAGKAAKRSEKKKAIALAKAIEGTYSENLIVANEYRYVVWDGERPVAAFPVVDEASTPEELAQRFELKAYRGPKKTP